MKMSKCFARFVFSVFFFAAAWEMRIYHTNNFRINASLHIYGCEFQTTIFECEYAKTNFGPAI